ncbi:MAG: patatin-like phospholipase family protein [Lachnospiraceae bacterium]|nr:patatin-like phospholipase family protein [Lachnospiraceae bacterium]
MKKILSIDGGGIKGVFSASFLTQIEEKCQIAIHEYFDLIAGTSTGGIIAAALAYGIPAKDILNLYLQNGNKIFPKRKGWPILKTKYKTEPLKKVLEDVFQDACIKDCKTRLVIPAYNIENDKVRVFKTPHADDLFFDKNIKLVDCILATTAAPLYFSPYRMQGGRYIDGGVGANNPSLIALVEGLTRCAWSANEISMLSVGGVNELGHNTGGEHMGLVDALKIQKSFMSAESQYAHNICSILLPKGQYVRINQEVKKQFALDNATYSGMRELKNYGDNQAMISISQIKTIFLKEKIEKMLLYNIEG